MLYLIKPSGRIYIDRIKLFYLNIFCIVINHNFLINPPIYDIILSDIIIGENYEIHQTI